MLIVDGNGLPIGMTLASANQAEVTLAPATLATVRVQRPRGRPRLRPGRLVCDRGYDAQAWRNALRKRGIGVCIPPRRKPKHTKRKRRGRPVTYDRMAYRRRFVVERTFAWLLSKKRLVVRWERQIGVYRGFVLVAMAMICLNRLLQ